MAVQFPNFLSVPVRTPDYSAIGDIFENYYKGRAMPKDDLIKAIQAEFARPAAEQALLSSRLSNKRSQMELNKMAREAEQQAQFENLLRQSMSGKPPVASPETQQPAPMDMPVNMPTTAPLAINPMAEKIRAVLAQLTPTVEAQEPMQGFDPSKMDKRFVPVDQAATGLPVTAYKPKPDVTSVGVPMQQAQADSVPQQNVPQQAQSDEIVLVQGQPHLAGIDQLWDARPEMHKYLEARGYKKTQEIKTDAKSGRTTIKTVYPSGTVTLKTIGRADTGEGIPLTNTMVTKHQQVSAAVDSLIPVLEKLKNMPSHSNTYLFGDLTATGEQKKYNRLISSAKENIIRAFGLNPTDSGLQTALDQLTIGGFESEKHYREGLLDLINEMLERKAYSDAMLKKSNKISPIDTSSGNSSSEGYSSNEWETA